MTMLGFVETDEYVCWYSTLKVVDGRHGRSGDGLWYPGTDALFDFAGEAAPVGTFARAGLGWLCAAGGQRRPAGGADGES
ncbi:hypothetical protein GIS00_23785 [Nakamurella sp. YIM 132087]|uniref:Uncharacterized protein n=1 Tax=Nakamurella alba TaxID=2665158 RepID=A0A7K1FS47_9ACTN|nr:hypothetical protein [Nakamurella alba]MTD16961.1 hypothetical protein [Nakamurella alba]